MILDTATLPPMVSYAQNAEDVVLRRAFVDVEEGFYVDVGASVPVEDSVTLHFYERGWRGVNIEPDAVAFDELSNARARDVNIRAAVGRGEGPITFYPSISRGQGTVVKPVDGEPKQRRPVQVPQISLGEVLEGHAPSRGIDFLKIDVEGSEGEVLRSTNWHGVRPRIVLVEAVDPTGRPIHDDWESVLLDASYRFGLFDGLNRFYCREEDAEALLPRLTAPANVLDNWRPAREVQAQDSLTARAIEAEGNLASAQVALEFERVSHESTRDALASEQASHADARQRLASEQAAHGMTRESLVSEQAALRLERESHAATSESMAVEQAALAHTRELLEEVLASTSWRITGPLRDASRLAKVMRRGVSS